MIPLFKHFVSPSAIDMVSCVLSSSCIGQGPMVDRFEKALEPWIGPNVTVNSGTSALWLAYDLAGIKEGDYVITTPMTCLATNIPLAHLGANILWADCDPKTGLIDPNSVECWLKWGPPVKAIICVDYAGVICGLGALRQLSNRYGCVLIDDAAHSFGANQFDLADFTAYSFQAIKHLTTGDGGSLATHWLPVHKQAILKRWFGLDRTDSGFRCEQIVTLKGYKFHMTDIAAAIGLANLRHVNDNIQKHREHAKAYNDAGLGYMPLSSSCWMYNIAVNNRDEFVKKMAVRGVQVSRTHNRNDRHTTIFKAEEQHLPGVTEFNDHQCSVPVGWWLTDEDVQHIIKSILESR